MNKSVSAWTISNCVKQLRECGYTCEAGLLENNVGYKRLLEIASEAEKWREAYWGRESEEAKLDAEIAALRAQVAAKVDWVAVAGERGAKLAAAIASNDYNVQALESLANENINLRQQIAEARALIGDLEWVYNDEYGYWYCPECDNTQRANHTDDCRIKSALAATQEGSDE